MGPVQRVGEHNNLVKINPRCRTHNSCILLEIPSLQFYRNPSCPALFKLVMQLDKSLARVSVYEVVRKGRPPNLSLIADWL